jgi:ribonuclease HI
MLQVIISTDGACSGNPGPGGYGVVLRFGEKTKELSGYESRTSNNRMELRAVIEGIAALKKQCEVLVRSDSQHVGNALANLDEMPNNGWTTKTGARRSNDDLLRQLYNVKHKYEHTIRFQHVSAHTGDPDNERCDQLAKQAIRDKVR